MPFAVRDRRWWNNQQPEDGEPAAQAEPSAEISSDKPTYVARLEAQLAEKDRLLEETRARQRRALAELDKSKERIERDAARQLELARRDMIRTQLDLLDDLDRAIESAKDSARDPALLEGVELVARRFLAKLQELGVSREHPMGERFDPARHEAVSMVPVSEPAQDGAVVGVIKPGYLIGDEPLRPALVAVGKLAS